MIRAWSMLSNCFEGMTIIVMRCANIYQVHRELWADFTLSRVYHETHRDRTLRAHLREVLDNGFLANALEL
jgi:hypothetical protein